MDRTCTASDACEWFLLIELSHPCVFYLDMDMMRGAFHFPPSPLGLRVVGARVRLLNICPSVTFKSLNFEYLHTFVIIEKYHCNESKVYSNYKHMSTIDEDSNDNKSPALSDRDLLLTISQTAALTSKSGFARKTIVKDHPKSPTCNAKS